MKILNLYAGIGGNRKLWGDDHEITAVEMIIDIGEIYEDLFPNDKVIYDDAHDYLLKHYKEFDFIWSSPPCPSHSRARFWGSFGKGRTRIYPDMTLYQEILFLQHYFKNKKWVVENVKPYYEPLMPYQGCGRHIFWSNFTIKKISFKTNFSPDDSLLKLQKTCGVDLSKCKAKMDKRVILRNMVNPELGLHVLKESQKIQQILI